MKYTNEQLEKDISDYVTETAPLRKAKGADYAGTYDTFSDLRSPQLNCRYMAMRILQKCCRVLNLLDKPPAVAEESIESEFKDIFNFAVYLPILYRQRDDKNDYKINK